MTIVATDAVLEVENTVGTATSITALTQANPGVATSAAHGLSNGDWVKLAVTDGMVELDEQLVRVANITTDTFELEGIDTTNYTTFSSGTWQEVTAWYTLSSSTSLDLGNASPTELDGTKLISKRAVTLYGLPGSNSGTIAIHHEPHTSAVQKLKAASVSDLLAFRMTWNNDNITGFAAKSAYSGGFSANLNSIVTGSVPITIPADIMEYSS